MPDSTESLVRDLTSDDRTVRASAQDALIALGPAAVEHVLPLLDLVILGGTRGIYAIAPHPDYTETVRSTGLPAVGALTTIRPSRPYDEAACRPTRALVLDVFNADNVPLLTDEQLPAGLTHEPTRRFLAEVGLPVVSDFYSLTTRNLVETGFVEHTWEGAKKFETPGGNGPFNVLGTWIGGVLLLDGPTGRVLRQSREGAVDDGQPGDPWQARPWPNSPRWCACNGSTCRPTT